MSDAAAPLGIFGGTFDPVHVGHLRLAQEAKEQLGLSRVLWIPAGQPRLRDAPATGPAQRVAMVRHAIAGNPSFSLDSGEADREGPSYMVETLERLRQEHGDRRPLVLLLGADAFDRLEAWHRWRELFGLAHLAVATRPGHEAKVGADKPTAQQGGRAKNALLAAADGGTALVQECRLREGTPDDLAASAAGRVIRFAICPLDISATLIRNELAAGRSARYLVPDAVLDYIHLHRLYRPS